MSNATQARGIVTYHHNRHQAWRKVDGKLVAPGAVDISFEVHKKVTTPEQWAAWWDHIDNRPLI